MAKEKSKKKSNLLLWGGLAATAIVGFVMLGKKAKTPEEKLFQAITTPGTPEYTEIAYWNSINKPGMPYENGIQDHFNYHTNRSRPDAFIHRFV